MQLASSIIAKMMAQLPPQTVDDNADETSGPHPDSGRLILATDRTICSSQPSEGNTVPNRDTRCAQDIGVSMVSRSLPDQITLRECMAIIQPRLPHTSSLDQLIAFCNATVLSVDAFADGTADPAPYTHNCIVYRLRLTQHCLCTQRKRYKSVIAKLTERRKEYEAKLAESQSGSPKPDADREQLLASIVRISKETVFMCMLANCKLAKLRRTMIRALADANARAVKLVAFRRLALSANDDYYNRATIATEDAMPIHQDPRLSITEDYTYCFEQESVLDDTAVAWGNKNALSTAFQSMRQRYHHLQTLSQRLAELDRRLRLRFSLALLVYNFKARMCAVFADEYAKARLYKCVLQYMKKVANPSAKMLRAAGHVVSSAHRNMVHTVHNKRDYWNKRVLCFIPPQAAADASLHSFSSGSFSTSRTAAFRTNRYSSLIDGISTLTLEGTDPLEALQNARLLNDRRSVSLFEKLVVGDRSFEASGSILTQKTVNPFESIEFPMATKPIEPHTKRGSCSQSGAGPLRRTSSTVLSDSYFAPLLRACQDGITTLSSVQVRRLFDTTLLIRNRLYKGQRIFYGAACEPINLSRSNTDTLVKYQTLNVEEFLATQNIDNYTLCEAAELLSLIFLQTRAFLALRLVLHRRLLCTHYNSILCERAFKVTMLRLLRVSVQQQTSKDDYIAQEFFGRILLRRLFRIMKRQIHREGKSWDDKSDSIFKFVIMRRQLKHWVKLVHNRRNRLLQMTGILHELERKIYLRPAFASLRSCFIKQQREAAIYERLVYANDMWLSRMALTKWLHRYRCLRALRRVVSQALPRWRATIEEEQRRAQFVAEEFLPTVFSSWKELTFGGGLAKTAGFTDAPKNLGAAKKALHFAGWSDDSDDEDLSDSHRCIQFSPETHLYDGNKTGYVDTDKTMHFDVSENSDDADDTNAKVDRDDADVLGFPAAKGGAAKISFQDNDLTLGDIEDDYWSLYSPNTATELRAAYRQVTSQDQHSQSARESDRQVVDATPMEDLDLVHHDNILRLQNEILQSYDRDSRQDRASADLFAVYGSGGNVTIAEPCTRALHQIDQTVEGQRMKKRKTIRFADLGDEDDNDGDCGNDNDSKTRNEYPTADREAAHIPTATPHDGISLSLDHQYTNTPTLRQAKIWYRRRSCHICISYWRQYYIEMQLAKKFYGSFPGRRLLASVFDEWATRAEMLSTRHRRIARLHTYLLKETCFLEWRYHAYVRRERAKQLQADERKQMALQLVSQIDRESSSLVMLAPGLEFPGLSSFVGQSKVVEPGRGVGVQGANRALTLRRIADEHYLFKIKAWISGRGILLSRERLIRTRLLGAEFSVPDSVIFQIPGKLDAWYLQQGFSALREASGCRCRQIV